MRAWLKRLGIGCGVLIALFVALVIYSASLTPTVTPAMSMPAAAATTPSSSSITARIGDRVRYPDGWSMTVQRLEEQALRSPSPRPIVSPKTPSPGLRLVVVTLRFDNGTSTGMAPDSDAFKMQDANGVRRNPFFMSSSVARPDALQSNQLAPNGFVVGTIVFEAPQDDRRLTLVYQPRRRTEVLVQLF